MIKQALIREQMLSNAHAIYAVMPTILAIVETMPINDGVRVGGIEIDGKPAIITLENKIVAALVKQALQSVDEACQRLLREAPSILPVDAAPVAHPTAGPDAEGGE